MAMKPVGGRNYPPVPGKIEWFSGTPPTPGWYPASATFNPLCLRWWNGHFWSWAIFPNLQKPPRKAQIALRASQPFFPFPDAPILWAEPWWKKS